MLFIWLSLVLAGFAVLYIVFNFRKFCTIFKNHWYVWDVIKEEESQEAESTNKSKDE